MARNKVRVEAEKRVLEVIERHRKDKELDPVRLMPEIEEACEGLRRRGFETLCETAWEDAVKKITRERGSEQAWLPNFIPPDTVLAIGKKKIVFLDVATPDQFNYSFNNHKKNLQNQINAFKPWQYTKKKILQEGYWTEEVSYPEAVAAYLRDHPEEMPPRAS
jgi:hypothetical protein